MEQFHIHFQIFLLIWLRLASAFMIAPVLSAPDISLQFRALAALTITMCIFPWAMKTVAPPSNDLMIFGLSALNEILVGVLLGFFLSVIFAAFRLSAQFFAVQIGLGMSEVFDPITQEQSPLLGYLFNTTAILVFLLMGGMHMTIRAVVDSYALAPAPDFAGGSRFLLEEAVRYFSFMFGIALKIAFPVIAASVIIIISLGFLGKAAPNANAMMLGLPIQFGVGMFIILAIMPQVTEIFVAIFSNAIIDFMNVMQRLATVQ